MQHFDYQHWLGVAGRLSRRSGEAADLLHDALIDAVRAGRSDFESESTRRWFAGVLRNRAALAARSSVRRVRREVTAGAAEAARRLDSSIADTDPATPDAFISSLPPSARSVATLVVSGMTAAEIRDALRITDTAFRQRLTTIRRAWRRAGPAGQTTAASPETRGSSHEPPLELGLIRQALLSHVRRLGGIGTHDPDGHLIALEPGVQSQLRPHRQRNQ